MPKKLYHRDFRFPRWKDSPFMKEILKNEKMAKVLQKPEERKNYYRTVKEIENEHYKTGKYKRGYADKLDVMREANWKFKNEAGDRIESNEARIIAKETVPFGPKYIEPQKTTFNQKELPGRSQIISQLAANRQQKSASDRISAIKSQPYGTGTSINPSNMRKTIAPRTVSGRSLGAVGKFARPSLMK